MNVKKLVLAALMAALCCVSTMTVSIPTPIGGYIHLGDGLVFLSGMLLGPVYGAAAAGIGSMLADLLLGYSIYAPATLLIKAAAAFITGFCYHISRDKIKAKHNLPLFALGMILGSITISSAYFGYEAFILGYGVVPSLKAVPLNLVQNAMGIAVGILLMPVFEKYQAGNKRVQALQ